MDVGKHGRCLRRLLELTIYSSRLYDGRIQFDEQNRAVLRKMLLEGLPKGQSYPELASVQFLLAHSLELRSLAYFLNHGPAVSDMATYHAWYALLKKHAARSCVMELNTDPLRFCAWYLQPYIQHGSVIGTRSIFGATIPSTCDLAVFELDGVRNLQCEATALGLLPGLGSMVRFGYFKAMVCEQQLQPSSRELDLLVKAAVLGSPDGDGTDELIAKEYLRRSKGWPICTF